MVRSPDGRSRAQTHRAQHRQVLGNEDVIDALPRLPGREGEPVGVVPGKTRLGPDVSVHDREGRIDAIPDLLRRTRPAWARVKVPRQDHGAREARSACEDLRNLDISVCGLKAHVEDQDPDLHSPDVDSGLQEGPFGLGAGEEDVVRLENGVPGEEGHTTALLVGGGPVDVVVPEGRRKVPHEIQMPAREPGRVALLQGNEIRVGLADDLHVQVGIESPRVAEGLVDVVGQDAEGGGRRDGGGDGDCQRECGEDQGEDQEGGYDAARERGNSQGLPEPPREERRGQKEPKKGRRQQENLGALPQEGEGDEGVDEGEGEDEQEEDQDQRRVEEGRGCRAQAPGRENGKEEEEVQNENRLQDEQEGRQEGGMDEHVIDEPRQGESVDGEESPWVTNRVEGRDGRGDHSEKAEHRPEGDGGQGEGVPSGDGEGAPEDTVLQEEPGPQGGPHDKATGPGARPDGPLLGGDRGQNRDQGDADGPPDHRVRQSQEARARITGRTQEGQGGVQRKREDETECHGSPPFLRRGGGRGEEQREESQERGDPEGREGKQQGGLARHVHAQTRPDEDHHEEA